MANDEPIKAAAYTLKIGLPSQSSSNTFQSNPTLATGDFKISKDGGSLANLASLPTVTPAGGKIVSVALSSSEMDADDIVVQASDAAGSEWKDVIIHIKTRTTKLAKEGADGDTVKTISDQIDATQSVISALTLQLRGLIPEYGTIGDTGNDTTHLHLMGLNEEYGDDDIINRLLMFKDESDGGYYAVWITAWDGDNDLATITPALPVTPESSTDSFWLTGVRNDVSISGLSSTAITRLEQVYNTDFASNYNDANKGWATYPIGYFDQGQGSFQPWPNNLASLVFDGDGNFVGSVGSVTGGINTAAGEVMTLDGIATLISELEAGSGLSAQETRDAMLLSPSEETPVGVGSIDAKLNESLAIDGKEAQS